MVVNHLSCHRVKTCESPQRNFRLVNMIVLMTAASAPLAMLGLSTPVAPQRSCVFMLHPQITPAVFESKEGKIVFPERTTEYPCSYVKRGGVTDITFTNQNGWRFSVHIGRKDEGSWTASFEQDTVSGRALSPFGD
jgi:hypothetical protein